MEPVVFRALSVVTKKYSLFDHLGEKMVVFFNSCRLLAGGIFVRQCRMD